MLEIIPLSKSKEPREAGAKVAHEIFVAQTAVLDKPCGFVEYREE